MTEQHYSANVECEMEYVCVREGGDTVYVCAGHSKFMHVHRRMCMYVRVRDNNSG